MSSDHKQLNNVLEGEKAFRIKQIESAWFDVSLNSYEQITTLPQELRAKLKDIPWLTLKVKTNLQSKLDNTRKILFELHDGKLIETVIMGRKNQKEPADENASDRYTICISSQSGCPMRCAFCATGRSGFKRNLTAEEIVDQYRYCQRLLAKENARINNIVVMGQGEPLLNYENMKRALNVLLKNTDLGPTKITVSTAGVVPEMERVLDDKDFPHVRWAVSLHSAIEDSRKRIMPSHRKDFLNFLVEWSKKYHNKFGTRTHFIGLEYIMLGGINDDEEHLRALVKLCKRMPHIRINLIPYNHTGPEKIDNISFFNRSSQETIDRWHKALMDAGFVSTIRYSQGQDIYAACGQLSNKAE